jgi:WD repeat-containing protein 40A
MTTREMDFRTRARRMDAIVGYGGCGARGMGRGWKCWDSRRASASDSARALALRDFRDLDDGSGADAVRGCDKVFGSCWLSVDAALISTKDNKLFEIELDRRGRCGGARFREVALGSIKEESARPRHWWGLNYCPPILSGHEGHGTVVAQPPPEIRRGGGHAVLTNCSREHVVASGGPGHDIVAFARVDDVLTPKLALKGHTDVVFGMDFVSRDDLVSCSRDGTVKLWSLPYSTLGVSESVIAPSVSIAPFSSCTQSSDRIRSVKVVDRLPAKQIATVSSTGLIHQLDASTLQLINQGYRCRGYLETACMATNGRIVAVGSRSHIGFADFRQRALYASVPLPYGDVNSVRSLSFDGPSNLLTVGGGRGLISFYEERMRRYLEEPLYGEIHQLYNMDPCVQLNDENLYHDSQVSEYLVPAILTHAWDETGTRLLVGGGPLQAILHGFFVGIWY